MPQAAPVAAPAPAPAQDHRLVAMLFDFDAMTAGEQARAQQNAIDFVQHKMQPPDTVALMAVDNARVSIAQDFTGDPVVLLSAILKLNASGHTASAPGAGPRLSTIDAAARLLAVLPQKKMLMYFSSGVTKSRGENQAEIRSVIETAQQSNVALYVIDVSGPATATAEFEYARRQAYANANFGSPAGDRAVLTPMGRIYIKYGPPHQIAGPSSGPQIWRYNYLEDFRTNVEFEFPQASAGPRINWPPPSATFEGSPAVAPALAEALSRELESRGEPAAANPIAGLPGRHASLQIYPPREFRFLTVPLDSLAGRVDILAEIRAGNTVVANLRDWIPSSSAAFQAAFVLDPGSYVCRLIVREQSSGRMYGETIDFEVK
jgi:GWxTD domain-containing protein